MIRNQNNGKYIFFTLIGAILLFCLYAKNIHNICTLWEIPDECGYLFNAALWTKQPWAEVISNNTSYYGFGYSVLLIPLFLVCDSGKELIQGAILVNVILVIVTYFIQIYLMKKIFSKVAKELWILASFACCIYPYIVCNIYKVNSEVLLNLQMWIIALLLYKAVKDNKMIYYILLSLAMVYIFFIHTRGIAIVATITILLFFLCIVKKLTLRRLVFLGIIIFCALLGLYAVKINITNTLGTGKIALSYKNNLSNLINASYLIDRIKWLFADLDIYVIQAVGKLFYLIASTMGFIVFGVSLLTTRLKENFRGKNRVIDEIKILYLFFGLAFLLMFLACCINGTGKTYAYMFYGRYFEYTITPLILLGIGAFYEKEIYPQSILWIMLVTLVTGTITLYLKNYVDVETIGIDTARISGISYIVQQNDGIYLQTIYMVIELTIIYLLICLGILSKKKYNILIILVLMFSFYQTNKVNIAEINRINQNCSSDIDVAEYILENYKDQNIYFIYEPYRYNEFFLRIQVFVKKYPIHLIFPEDIEIVEEGDYIITYKDSEKAVEFRSDTTTNFVMKSTHYELFVE